MTVHTTDVAVVGAGPVGLFAVFECGMLKIRCHVIDTLDVIGGQCAALYPDKPIYDIPAYPKVMAGELIEHLAAQAAPFEPVYHLGQQVVAVRPNGARWRVETSITAARGSNQRTPAFTSSRSPSWKLNSPSTNAPI